MHYKSVSWITLILVIIILGIFSYFIGYLDKYILTWFIGIGMFAVLHLIERKGKIK